MRKLLLAFALILLLAAPAFATSWYACTSGGNINASNQFTSSTGVACGSCSGNYLTWPPSNGDTLYSNNCASAIVIPPTINVGSTSVQVTLTNTAGSGNAGGSFSYALTSGDTSTLYANITAGAAAVLTITGSAGTLNIGASGYPVTITGGTAASAYGVSDSHTSVTVNVYATINGGSNATAYAYYFSGASGSVSITGNATAGTGGAALYLAGAGTGTINGNCQGGDTSVNQVGCQAASSGDLFVTGNLIFGKRASAVAGAIRWQPANVNNKILFPWSDSATTGTWNQYSVEAPPMVNQTMTGGPGIYSVSNVVSGVVYGDQTGTASTSTGVGGVYAY